MSEVGHGITPALLRVVEKRSLVSVMIALGAVVVVVGAIDVATGWEMSFSIFYLFPVALASWRGGRSAAIGMSLVCAVAWFWADRLAGHAYTVGWIPYWNATVRFGLFLVSGLTLAALRSALARANELARIDALTGLANGRAFREQLHYHVGLAGRYGDPITLAAMDLDHFKAVNDTHGHAAGDDALATAARVLRSRLRGSDVAARVGGDEFVLVLPRTSEGEAARVLESVRQRIEKDMAAAGWPITASVGFATRRGDLAVDELTAAADGALYQAKAAGRNRVQAAASNRLGEASATRSPLSVEDR